MQVGLTFFKIYHVEQWRIQEGRHRRASLSVQFLPLLCNFREEIGQIIGLHATFGVGALLSHLGDPGSATAESAYWFPLVDSIALKRLFKL